MNNTKDVAKLLANRINQEPYILQYLNKIYYAGLKKGKEQAVNFAHSSTQFNAFFDENNECIVDDVYRARVIEHNEPTFLIEYNHNGQTDLVQTKRVKRPKSV